MIPAFTKAARKAALSLALSCGIAAPALAQTQDGVAADGAVTYWKTNIVDAVIALRTCPETGVCGTFVWVNPKDRDAYTFFHDRKQRHRGPVTEADISALCGFSPRMDFKKVSDNVWEGQMEARGQGFMLNMRATIVDDTHIKVHASKFLLWKNDIWTRVAADDPRYPHCVSGPQPG
jgi:hypothetical protein